MLVWIIQNHLGKFETGSKTALPIFENFVKKAVKKSEARPFKVAENITMMVVDPKQDKKLNFHRKIQLWKFIKVKMLLMEKYYIQIIID